MKNLMLSTAILAGLSTVAFAQDAAAPGMFRPAADPMNLRASDFIGMRIYASEAAIDADEYDGMQQDWADIGEVNDVILSRDGTVDAVLVDIGGFLGMGERQVAVGMEAIKFVGDGSTGDRMDDFFLVMNAARADLEAAPDYMAATDGTAAPAADATTTAATDATTAPAATDTTTTAATDSTTAAPAATDTTTTATDTTTTAPAATDSTAMDTPREPLVRDGYMSAEVEYLTSEKLTGARVYDANDEWIGDVSTLVLTDSGEVSKAIVDIGGFLGMGEKPVALDLSEIDILRNDAGDEVRVYLSRTREEMEAMPTFEG